MKPILIISLFISAVPALAMDTANFILSRVYDTPISDTREMKLNGTGETLHVDRNTIIYDKDVAGAFIMPDGAGARVVVKLTAAGKAKLEAATEEWTDRRMAIVLFGKLKAAPYIRQKISADSFEISGAFSNEEAQELVEALTKK